VAAKDRTSDASWRITLSVLSIYWLLSWPTSANLRPETRHTSTPTPHYTLACIVWCHSTRKVMRSGCGHTTPRYFFRAMWHHWGCRLRTTIRHHIWCHMAPIIQQCGLTSRCILQCSALVWSWCRSTGVPGAWFTKCLTIYHKIILSLSQDGLTIVTYSVIRFLIRISWANLQTLSQTILTIFKRIVPKNSLAFSGRCFVNPKTVISRS